MAARNPWPSRAATGEVGRSRGSRTCARRLGGGAREEGALALAIVCMHAHIRPDDEIRLAEVARARSASSTLFVLMKCLARSASWRGAKRQSPTPTSRRLCCVGHAERLAAGLPAATLRFMQSSGGLTDAASFRGPNALLSGPAGGVCSCSICGEGSRNTPRRSGSIWAGRRPMSR